MRNEFDHCPGCKEVYDGAWVYECRKCGRFMCYTDGIFGFGAKGCWKGDRCPRCASHRKENGVETTLSAATNDASANCVYVK